MSTRRTLGMADPPTGRVVTGNYLRYLREDNKLTAAEVRGRVPLSNSAMSRIESAGRAVSASEATALLSAYGVTEHEGFIRLVSQTGRQVAADMYQAADDHQGWSDRLAALEYRAVAASFFNMVLIPRCLQVPEYTAACYVLPNAGNLVPRPASVGAPGATMVLEASVLARPVGGTAAFADQIQHLIDAVDQGLIRLQVMPMDAQVYAPDVNVTELVLPDGVRLYATEGWGASYRGGADEEVRMGEFLQRAAAASLPKAESRALLEHNRDAAIKGKPLLRL
ncbi:Scr1 family TA system antitoxin-like transcriptional regulator [Streptomyces sp. NPDC056638]|uniref:Scr1 family TA system antitoxin-like transcriptional regulator n=1 Tax=Streptomyces sp. NPDC056638 TaxID=3345887 RepID=UPI0036A63AB2